MTTRSKKLDREIAAALDNKSKGSAPLTPAQLSCLHDLSTRNELWWHDLPAGTREILHKRGLIQEVQAMQCGTLTHRHPGYMGISKAGLAAIGK